jgi:hypothetical protein
MIKLWRREARTFEPRQMVNHRLLELETAKEILDEVFHARPSDVEDMIQRRLDEKSWFDESWHEQEEQWPASVGVSE